MTLRLLAAGLIAAAILAAMPAEAQSLGSAADAPVAAHDLRFVTGTVTKVAWGDTVQIWLALKQPSGAETVLPFRVDSSARMAALGWARESVPVGEEITVQYLPYSGGEPGGKVVRLTLASGLFLETPDSLWPAPRAASLYADR